MLHHISSAIPRDTEWQFEFVSNLFRDNRGADSKNEGETGREKGEERREGHIEHRAEQGRKEVGRETGRTECKGSRARALFVRLFVSQGEE